MAKRYATLLTAVTLLWIAVLSEAGSAQQASEPLGAAYEGTKVESIEIPAIDERDRPHLLALLAQKPEPPFTAIKFERVFGLYMPPVGLQISRLK